MAKSTNIKDALKKWEEKHETPLAEAKEVLLCFQWPPINKMDNSLSVLTSCEKLSLSTNQIEKIAGLANLKHLKVLSLGRNQIRSFSGIESLADTLEELWISYNMIEKVKGINLMKVLKVLYIAHNLIKDWGELGRLHDCIKLEELVFVGNPLSENMDEQAFRDQAIKRLTRIKKLDGDPVIRDV